MLSLLHIENIAVIECADISFDQGFHVLTGETGAGKSIVIDAISAILGQRAYRDMIRTGANKASVRAVFTQVPAFAWFEENGVPYDEETVIRLVGRGLGVSMMTELMIRGRTDDVLCVPVRPAAIRELGMGTHIRKKETENIRKLKGCILEFIREHTKI